MPLGCCVGWREGGPVFPHFEGPGWKALILNLLAPTAPHPHSSPKPCTKCHPRLHCSHLTLCAGPGPSVVWASWSSQDLKKPKTWVYGLCEVPLLRRDGESPPLYGSLNLDAIRGNQPKTLRQLLPQDYSQPAKGIRVIIQSLDF